MTPDKGKMMAAAAAEAFYAASQRFRTYGTAQIAAGATGILTTQTSKRFLVERPKASERFLFLGWPGRCMPKGFVRTMLKELYHRPETISVGIMILRA